MAGVNEHCHMKSERGLKCNCLSCPGSWYGPWPQLPSCPDCEE